MTITAKCILKSSALGPNKIPDLYTVVARYPRFIHAEAKTHRIIEIDDACYEFMQEISLMDDPNLSRNASSSRAIPVERLIEEALNDPAMPVSWGSNKPGMQAGAEIDTPIKSPWHPPHLLQGSMLRPDEAWLEARDRAVDMARAFMNAGYHKQIANRLLEPFTHITLVCTATEWDNFFKLRRHSDADPTMQALANAIYDAMAAPEEIQAMPEYGWHLPFISIEERGCFATGREAAMVSAARCARVSYLNHDGSDPEVKKDLALAQKLLDAGHMSPFEHQARVGVMSPRGTHDSRLQSPQFGNFVGWHQFRKMVEPEPSRRY